MASTATVAAVDGEAGAKHALVYGAVLDLLTRLPAGASLPSERELSTAHGVSRPTVRRALMLLEGEGRIRNEHGRRRVATASKIALPLQLTSLSDDMRARGITPGAKLIDVSRLTPGADEVAHRALGTDRELLRVERL